MSLQLGVSTSCLRRMQRSSSLCRSWQKSHHCLGIPVLSDQVKRALPQCHCMGGSLLSKEPHVY